MIDTRYHKIRNVILSLRITSKNYKIPNFSLRIKPRGKKRKKISFKKQGLNDFHERRKQKSERDENFQVHGFPFSRETSGYSKFSMLEGKWRDGGASCPSPARIKKR